MVTVVPTLLLFPLLRPEKKPYAFWMEDLFETHPQRYQGHFVTAIEIDHTITPLVGAHTANAKVAERCKTWSFLS